MLLSRLRRLAMLVVLIGCAAGPGSRLATVAPGNDRTARPAAEADDPPPKVMLTTPMTVRGRATDDEGRAVVGAMSNRFKSG